MEGVAEVGVAMEAMEVMEEDGMEVLEAVTVAVFLGVTPDPAEVSVDSVEVTPDDKYFQHFPRALFNIYLILICDSEIHYITYRIYFFLSAIK